MQINKDELYKSDTYLWTLLNIKHIDDRNYEAIDFENLKKELEYMGESEIQKLTSYLSLVFLHLLKWQYQPERRGSSWQKSMRIHRKHAKEQIRLKPSLKGQMYQIVTTAYEDALTEAYKETNLDIFPDEMPFTLEQALDDAWLPE
jgi:hypothetical protein